MKEWRKNNREKYLAVQQERRIRQRDADPERFYQEKREKHKAWRDANPEKIADHRSRAQILYYHGITIDEYEGMVESQNGCCSICQQVPTRRLQVDHDHKTGEIRGLLCMNCNRGLGYLKDSPKVLAAALEYLNKNGGGYGPK